MHSSHCPRSPSAYGFARLLRIVFVALAAACSEHIVSPKPEPSEPPAPPVLPATHVVISQVYGGGGNSGATLKNDFVELYNAGTTAVSLNGWSVQYASATGTTWQVTALGGSIPPNGYYLIQESAGTGGTVGLPAADGTGTIAMSATAGKVALVTNATALSGPCPIGEDVSDFVGYGGAGCFEGTSPVALLTNTTAAIRKLGGLQESNDNAVDFMTGSPDPHNIASAGVAVGSLDHVGITGGSYAGVKGIPLQFIAVGQDATNKLVAGAGIVWTSSDPAVAKVDNTGKVMVLDASATPITLTAKAVSGAITSSAIIFVTARVSAPVATVTVQPSTWTMKVAQTKTFAATALDASNAPAFSSIAWSSGAPAIATVDSLGVVTARGIGSTVISATASNGTVGTAALSVLSAASLTLNSGKTSLALGMQTQFFFAGTDALGKTITSVAWTTSNASIITVDQNGIVTGRALGTAQLTATAPDGSTASSAMTVYIAAGASNVRLGHNTEFGEPKDSDPSDDFIIRRAQYTVSYNPRRGGANWVSWNLDASHIGGSGRCTGTCYSADTTLIKAGLAAYTTADWVSNNTYDRGHMAPSADWTSSEADNNTTFFLSNFLPQTHDMNAGPWGRLENALRDSVATGREAYVIAGGVFANGVGLGTLQNLGKIAIPNSTWKIAVITPAGTGLNADGTLPPNSSVLAVLMPNITGVAADGFEKYLTTVAQIEQATGYDFLALLAESTQCRVEVRACRP